MQKLFAQLGVALFSSAFVYDGNDGFVKSRDEARNKCA